MANQTITANPAEVTAGDIAESVLTLGYGLAKPYTTEVTKVNLEVTAGTVRFNTNGNGADGAPIPAGGKVTVNVKDNKINFIAAAATDKFIVST